MEMGVVITLALVALWSYRLVKSVSAFAAGSTAAFGLVNAGAVLGCAAMLVTAFDVSRDTSLAVSGEAQRQRRAGRPRRVTVVLSRRLA